MERQDTPVATAEEQTTMEDDPLNTLQHPEAHGFTDDYAQRFSGVGRLYGIEGMKRLASAHVCVVGVGGVGSWTVEALARSGIGKITLVDLDDVCVTNTNRQLHAMTRNVGRSKIEVMAERAKAIHPEIEIALVHDFLSAQSVDSILHTDYDFVVDAIDQFRNKALIASRCASRLLPLVVCGGAGGRRDPSRVEVADLTETSGDRLLAILRKTLRQKHGFSRKGIWGIPCVYTAEPPVYPDSDGGVCHERPEGTLRLDCGSGFGTATFVTGTVGFAAAGVVVKHIAEAVEFEHTALP